MTHNWKDKDVHIFLKGISPKMNITALLNLKPTYLKAAV